jgi:hypothetical protein
MSSKEEKLRRSVLSRESAPSRHVSKQTVQALAMAGVLAAGGIMPGASRVDFSATRGRFSGGDFHPDKCSCAKCAAWRKAERHR